MDNSGRPSALLDRDGAICEDMGYHNHNHISRIVRLPRGAEGIGMLKPNRNFRSRRDEPRRCRKPELKLAERATEDMRL